MEEAIKFRLNPDFIKPLEKKHVKRTPVKVPEKFYKQFQDDSIQSLVEKIDFPPAAMKLRKQLDNIEKQDNTINIEEMMDDALVFAILTHKNAKLIKDVKFNIITPYCKSESLNTYYNQIEECKKLFSVSPPEELYVIKHLFEQFSHVYDEELLKGKETESLHGFNNVYDRVRGLFGEVFTTNSIEKTILRNMRMQWHEINYLPTFWYYSDNHDWVTHGFIFDMQHNLISGHAHDDPSSSLKWNSCYYDEFFKIIGEGINGDVDIYHDDDEVSYDDLNDILKDTDVPLLWLLNYFATNYYNESQIKSLVFDKTNMARYDRSKQWDDEHLLSKNGTHCISNTNPRIVLSIKDNFDTMFDWMQIKTILRAFESCSPDARGFRDLAVYKHLNLDEHSSDDEIYEAFVSFAEDEIRNERYGLALLLGLTIWNNADENTCRYAVRLLKDLPDDVCHPLIKSIAIVHAETRFETVYG